MAISGPNTPFDNLKALLHEYCRICDEQVALLGNQDLPGAIALNEAIDELEAIILCVRSTEPTVLFLQLRILMAGHLWREDSEKTPVNRVLDNTLALVNHLDNGDVGEMLPIGVRLPSFVLAQHTAEAARR
jgi:hypothetical protein